MLFVSGNTKKVVCEPVLDPQLKVVEQVSTNAIRRDKYVTFTGICLIIVFFSALWLGKRLQPRRW